MGYYDMPERSLAGKLLRAATVSLGTTAVGVISGLIGIRLGPWLLVIWAAIYGKILLYKIDNVAGILPIRVLDQSEYSWHGFVTFAWMACAATALLGFYAGGRKWAAGLLFFWGPLWILPLWLITLGIWSIN